MSEPDKAPMLIGKIEVLSGFAFPSSGFNQLDGLPLIRIRDLGGSTTEIRFRGAYDPIYRVSKGDLLVGMDGDFEVYRWEGDDALLNQRVCKISSVSREIDQGFLYWYLKPNIAEIHRKTPQTTVRHLSTKDIYAIAEPPIGFPAQERIAEVLDTLDTAIHATEALIDKLKAVKQGLLHDLLTRGIDANGQLRSPQSEAPQLYKESPLGWIPRAWGVQPLAAYTASEITYGIVQAGPHIPDGVPYIRTGDMSGDVLIRGSMLCTSRRIANSYARSEVRAGEIVMAIRATVGKVLPVPDDLDGANLTQGTARISPNSKTDGAFLLWAIRHSRAQQAIQLEIKGTTFAEITLGALRQVPIAAPIDISEQREIAKRLTAIDERLRIEQEGLAKRLSEKSGLMDDLLTGRVRVDPLRDAMQHATAPMGV